MRFNRILAWSVHFYTATGLICAAWIAVFIFRGGDENFRAALLLMLLATVIDSTDGWLARRARVKEILPEFDGRKLDDIVDFHNYTSLPLLLVWRSGLLPAGYGWLLLLPLLASVYGFSQSAAKTPDGFFTGFPSYWNVIAFYLYFLQPPVWFTVGVLLLFSVLTFIPTLYLYPSQRAPFSKLTNLLAIFWTLLLIFVLLSADGFYARRVGLASLAFPLYYLFISWWLTFRRQRILDERTVIRPEISES